MAKQSFREATASWHDSCKKRIDSAVKHGIISHEEGEKRKAVYDKNSTWIDTSKVADIQVTKF